jgi:predicted nucleic acid-binding protein
MLIVDADVVSYGFKKDDRAELYAPHLAGEGLVISFMTLAELDRWPLEHNWGSKRQEQLRRHMSTFTVYYADRALCQWWAVVVDDAKRRGYKVRTADAWNAATALLHGVPLVTHNPKDYRGVTGLKIITEASP